MPQSDLTSITARLQDKIVLNVDDNEMNQLVLLKILQTAGLKIVAAHNGAEAVKKLQGGLRPDFILMDLEMPVMNGLQASEYIRTQLDLNIPIIINSASVSAYQRFKMRQLGVNDFLEKPYHLQDIYSKLLKNIDYKIKNFTTIS